MASAKKTSSNSKSSSSPSSKKSKVGSPMKKKLSSSPNKKQSNSPKKSKKNQRTGQPSRPGYQHMVTEALTTVNYFNILIIFNENNSFFFHT